MSRGLLVVMNYKSSNSSAHQNFNIMLACVVPLRHRQELLSYSLAASVFEQLLYDGVDSAFLFCSRGCLPIRSLSFRCHCSNKALNLQGHQGEFGAAAKSCMHAKSQ